MTPAVWRGTGDEPSTLATPAPSAMTSQGTTSGRFTRAIEQRNLFQAELGLRGMREPVLLVLVDYLELLADVRPDKFDRAAVRWHGRLELETPTLTVAESQFALAALGALRQGNHDAAGVLRKLLRSVRPTCAAACFLERGQARRTGSPSPAGEYPGRALGLR